MVPEAGSLQRKDTQTFGHRCDLPSPDRLLPLASPGPAHDALRALKALDLPGGRARGAKLTLARRFAPDRRPDGTAVEHPFDAAATRALLERAKARVEKKQPKEEARPREARTEGEGGEGGGEAAIA